MFNIDHRQNAPDPQGSQAAIRLTCLGLRVSDLTGQNTC
jgi:hypothetical protein